MTDELIAFLKRQEGLRLAPYLDQVKLPTIGYGHRIPSLKVAPITEARAEQMLREDVARAEEKALRLCPKLTGRRLAALTDLVFNAGDGALRGSGTVAALNREDWVDAANRFQKWDKAHKDGKLIQLPELTRRRKMGADWILTG